METYLFMLFELIDIIVFISFFTDDMQIDSKSLIKFGCGVIVKISFSGIGIFINNLKHIYTSNGTN